MSWIVLFLIVVVLVNSKEWSAQFLLCLAGFLALLVVWVIRYHYREIKDDIKRQKEFDEWKEEWDRKNKEQWKQFQERQGRGEN